jgi:hypothetical protein
MKTRSESREKLTLESCAALLGLLAFVHGLGVFSFEDGGGNEK